MNKLKKLVLCISILALVGIMSACGQADPESEGRSVTVVSPHPVDFMRPLINEFETETGITVKIIKCGTSEAISRIREGEGIDVLWGGSVLSVGSYEDSFASSLQHF